MKNEILNETYGKLEAIVDTRTGKIEKYEWLVRHNKYTPSEILNKVNNGDLFLKQLEDSVNLTKKENIKISINIDNNVISNKKIIEQIKKYNKNDLKNIEFEILEENIDLNNLKDFLKVIENLGVKINLDDFGSKEQTMQRVKTIKDIAGKKLKSIKLDGELVKKYCNNNKEAKEIIEEIKEYANKNNILIVAEHIENIQMLEKIKDIADLVQGFMFSNLYSNLQLFSINKKNLEEEIEEKLEKYIKKKEEETNKIKRKRR